MAGPGQRRPGEAVDSFVLTLDIPAERFRAWYAGAVRDVVARAEDGRRVQFPASALRPFVTHDGVHGRFRLRIDGAQRLISLERLG